MGYNIFNINLFDYNLFIVFNNKLLFQKKTIRLIKKYTMKKVLILIISVFLLSCSNNQYLYERIYQSALSDENVIYEPIIQFIQYMKTNSPKIKVLEVECVSIKNQENYDKVFHIMAIYNNRSIYNNTYSNYFILPDDYVVIINSNIEAINRRLTEELEEVTDGKFQKIYDPISAEYISPPNNYDLSEWYIYTSGDDIIDIIKKEY